MNVRPSRFCTCEDCVEQRGRNISAGALVAAILAVLLIMVTLR